MKDSESARTATCFMLKNCNMFYAKNCNMFSKSLILVKTSGQADAGLVPRRTGNFKKVLII
jgi:hypothetical protein